MSTTPLSMSCGPKWASLVGNAAWKRERNMTMNWFATHQHTCLRQENASCARQFVFQSSATHRDIRVVREDLFMGR